MNLAPAPTIAAFILTAALLPFAPWATGCAHVGPVVTCLGENVSGADVQRIENDLATRNFADLAAEAVVLGWPTIACVVDNRAAARPELQPAAAQFKAAHAKELGTSSLSGGEPPAEEATMLVQGAPVPKAGAAEMSCPAAMHSLTPWRRGMICVPDGNPAFEDLARAAAQHGFRVISEQPFYEAWPVDPMKPSFNWGGVGNGELG